jgi:hypothetical protein
LTSSDPSQFLIEEDAGAALAEFESPGGLEGFGDPVGRLASFTL